MQYDDLLFAPIFNIHGVSAELLDRNGKAFPVTAIDRTKGVEITEGKVGVATVRPVAAVRASELAALEVQLSELDGGALRLNGLRWKIDYPMERPTPNGATDGEVWLILSAEGC